jgi:hypothetical protein
MSKIQVVSVEGNDGERSLPEWGDALRKHVGQRPLPELTRCVSIGKQRFAGRVEFATLDHAVAIALGLGLLIGVLVQR